MAIKFANLASSTLASGITSSATSLTVASASGFPTLGASDYCYVTIGEGVTSEIVKVTAISGTTFTIVRAQDGTTASAFSSGEVVALRVVAAALDDIASAADTESVSISGDTMTGSLTITDGTTNGASTIGSASNDLLLDTSGDTGLTIRSGASSTGVISFASPTDHNVGQLYYDNNTDSMVIRSNDAVALTLNSSQNATFAGTITSGAITSTGNLTIDYTGHQTGDAGILVTNDASDWGIKVDKDGTADYGILSQTDGENALVVRNAAGVNKVQIQGDGDASFVGSVSAAEFELPSEGFLDWANGDARIREGLVNNYSLSFQTYDGSNLTTALRLDGDNTATFDGTIKNGSYTRILTGGSNSGQITFNADWDGSGYVPDYAGASYAGMAVMKMAGGGYGRIEVYTKNSGTTATSQALSGFTKVAEFHDAGYFDASNGLRVGGLALADTSRNITAGTITSGSITSSGDLTIAEDAAPIIILNDTDATNSSNLHTYVSFRRSGTESGYVGYGSSNNSNFYVKGEDDVILRSGSTDAVTVSGSDTTFAGDVVADFLRANSGGVYVAGGGTYSDPGSQMYLHADASGYGRLAVFDMRFLVGANSGRTTEALRLESDGDAVFGGSISGVTSITSSGAIAINSSGHAYQYINGATSYESGIIWQTNSTNKWETYIPGGTNNFSFYSYVDQTSPMTLYGTGETNIAKLGIGLAPVNWDTGNLSLDISGNTSIRGALFFGISTNNINSWATKIWNSGSTAYLNAQTFQFDNTGYGSHTFFNINSTRAQFGQKITFANDSDSTIANYGLASAGTRITGDSTGRMTTDITGMRANKLSGGTAWNGDLVSLTAIQRGCVARLVPNQTNLHFMFGLSENPESSSTYASINFAWYCTGSSAALQIYEGGTYVGNYGTYATGSDLRVVYDHHLGKVYYLHNGVVKRTVEDLGSGKSYYFDSSWYSEAANQTQAIEFKPLEASIAQGRQHLKFNETGHYYLGNNDWSNVPQQGDFDTGDLAYNASAKGVQITGASKWIRIPCRIPIDPDLGIRYRVKVRVSKETGTGTFYCGHITLDENFDNLSTDAYTSYNYSVASNTQPGSDEVYEATIGGGYNPSGGASSVYYFDPEGKYFDLIIICNYQGSGVTTIHSVEVETLSQTTYTQNIRKLTGSSDPILINSGLNAAKALRVYYDMDVYNTIQFTNSSWTMQGKISGASDTLNYQSESHVFKNKSGGADYGTVTSGSQYWYSNTSSNDWSMGRNSTEKARIYVDDSNVQFIAYQDSDDNGAHALIFDRSFGGTGANNIYFSKAGTWQANLDTYGQFMVRSTTNARLGVYSYSDANVTAKVSATWSSLDGSGMYMAYHPNSAVGYIENSYNKNANQVYGDIQVRQKDASGNWVERLLFDNDSDKAVFKETLEVDSGESSTLSVLCDDAGVATIRALGTNQGTGRLFVGQSATYGGGIEYNGDNTPTSTGAGADYIALYRVSNGSYDWTARNYYSLNDWEFRGKLKAGGTISANNNSVMRATVLSNSGYTHTGCYVIRLPGSTSNYSMPVIRVTTYEYNSRAANIYYIGGHNWSTASNWYNASVNHIGKTPRSVRLGHDGTSHCIVLGETTDTWDYESITVDILNHPTYYQNNQDWSGSWSIYQTTTMPSTVSGNQLSTPLSSGFDGKRDFSLQTSGKLVMGNASYDSNGNYNGDPYWTYDNTFYSRHVTQSGYIQFGPMNTSGAHIYTDRDRFYFNKIPSLISNSISSYDSDFILYRAENSSYNIVINTSGLVSSQNVTAYSDRRLKTEIEPITGALETVKKLQGVKYTRIDSGNKNIGFIAQDIEENCPEIADRIVYTANDEMKTKNLSYQSMVALLTEAIKTQQEQIETLSRRIEELENGND